MIKMVLWFMSDEYIFFLLKNWTYSGEKLVSRTNIARYYLHIFRIFAYFYVTFTLCKNFLSLRFGGVFLKYDVYTSRRIAGEQGLAHLESCQQPGVRPGLGRHPRGVFPVQHLLRLPKERQDHAARHHHPQIQEILSGRLQFPQGARQGQLWQSE